MSKVESCESINVVCTVLTISMPAMTLSISTVQPVFLYRPNMSNGIEYLFPVVPDAFQIVFRRKNNESSTSFLASSSIFSHVLSNAFLYNAPLLD